MKKRLNGLGARLVEHQTTGSNKHDPEFGVLGLAPLFEGGLYHFPQVDYVVGQLFDQLVAWEPVSQKVKPRNRKDDLVMALWIAEVGCFDLIERGRVPNVVYRDTPWNGSSRRVGVKRFNVVG